MSTQRRMCLLCGRAFVVRISEGTEDPERDSLCPACLSLPTPPEEPGEAASQP
jgi:hypothetical protein